VYTKATRNEWRQKYWGKFVDIPDLRLGPPRLAFGTPRGSQDPRLRTTVLESMFTSCLVELTYLDMAVNSKKSCCLRVGRRCDKHCKNICTSGGHLLTWVDEMRFNGLFIV